MHTCAKRLSHPLERTDGRRNRGSGSQVPPGTFVGAIVTTSLPAATQTQFVGLTAKIVWNQVWATSILRVVPIMSPLASAPSESLFGHTRSAVLSVLYGHADQAFYLRQLVRAMGTGHGALQRELKRLTDMGIIVRRSQGNQVLFQANVQSPIFPEIKSWITKTIGIHDVIRSSRASLGAEIKIAFVYGSVARQLFGPSWHLETIFCAA